jgi:transglutaminase-like putative cysteine protease
MTEQNTGWRDISTAPKDGTPILITASGVNPVVAFQSDVMPKWWLNPTGIEVDWFAPTSWQPLPPPPGEEASRKDWRKLACDAADRVEHLQEELDTLQARCDELRDELYQLKLLICGGEGEPEGANMLTLRDADEIEDRLDALQARCDKLEDAARRILEWDADPIRDALFDGRGHPSRDRWGEDFEALRSVVDGGE